WPIFEHAALVGLRQHGLDGLHELARRIDAQLDGHTRARADGLVDEIDVERVLERQIVRMVVRDIGLADLDPVRTALAAPVDLHLVSNHRAHDWLLVSAYRRFLSRNAKTFFQPSTACSCR